MGTGQSFLFAAAIIGMVPGPACSRSTSITRARTSTMMLVSAPLYSPSQIRRTQGFGVSAERLKGSVSMLSGRAKNQILMNAVSNPANAGGTPQRMNPAKGTVQTLPFRGGNWNNGAGAGVFALNLNNPRSNVNTNVGFRAALPSLSDIQSSRALSQYGGDKGVCFPPIIFR